MELNNNNLEKVNGGIKPEDMHGYTAEVCVESNSGKSSQYGSFFDNQVDAENEVLQYFQTLTDEALANMKYRIVFLTTNRAVTEIAGWKQAHK